MNRRPETFLLLFVVLFVGLQGCYPSKVATSVPPEGLVGTGQKITTPARVVLRDATVVLFPGGFTVQNNALQGQGEQCLLTGKRKPIQMLKFPLEDVAAITKYELQNSSGEISGSFFQGIFGTAVTTLSVYCLVCPKCCFGSCPTVYTFDGSKYNLEAELFSQCIAKKLEESDTDILTEPVPPDNLYKIRLTNEALETHYINQFTVFAAYRPKGTKVFSSNDGDPVLVGSVRPPNKVVSRSGRTVTGMVQSEDSLSYRSDDPTTAGLLTGDPMDWLDVTFDVPEGATECRLVARLKNTLLSTVLLYNLVLASQGFRTLSWQDRMDSDEVYATMFRNVYQTFSGVTIKVLRDGEWIQTASIHDVGPLAWKTVTFVVPVDHAGEQTVRFQFVADNFMIDNIGIERTPPISQAPLVEELKLVEVLDNSGKTRNDILPLVSQVDARYLVTDPGQSFRMGYSVPVKPGLEATVFVKSRGYYTEWIRGKWVRENHADYTFDLFDLRGTLAQLGREWMEGKHEIESTFFETRIPLKEAQ